MSDQIVEAINDLTRVTIALNGGFGTKSEAVRRMAALSIPSGKNRGDFSYATAGRGVDPREGKEKEERERVIYGAP